MDSFNNNENNTNGSTSGDGSMNSYSYGTPTEPPAQDANSYAQPTQPESANPYSQPAQPENANPYSQPSQPSQPMYGTPSDSQPNANPYSQTSQSQSYGTQDSNPYSQPQSYGAQDSNPYGQQSQNFGSTGGGSVPPTDAYGNPMSGNDPFSSQSFTGNVEPTNEKNNFALASMIVGIVSIVCCCISCVSLIGGIAAIALGIVALNKNKEVGKPMAITGIVTGVVAILIAIVAYAYTALNPEVVTNFMSEF